MKFTVCTILSLLAAVSLGVKLGEIPTTPQGVAALLKVGGSGLFNAVGEWRKWNVPTADYHPGR